MEFERANRLANEGAALYDTENMQPFTADLIEQPNNELFDSLMERIFSATDRAEPLERTLTPHLVRVTVDFLETQSGLKLDLEADRTAPTPSPDSLKVTWSYRNADNQQAILAVEAISRAGIRDESDKSARDRLRLLEESVTVMEDGLSHSGAVAAVIMA